MRNSFDVPITGTKRRYYVRFRNRYWWLFDLRVTLPYHAFFSRRGQSWMQRYMSR